MRALHHPPLLFALGRAFARRAPERAQGGGVRVAGAAAVGACLAFDALNVAQANQRVTPAFGGVAASYPLWFWLGWDAGRRRRSL